MFKQCKEVMPDGTYATVRYPIPLDAITGITDGIYKITNTREGNAMYVVPPACSYWIIHNDSSSEEANITPYNNQEIAVIAPGETLCVSYSASITVT